MSIQDLKNIEETLKVMTNNHKAELSIQYMEAFGQKLKNHDKSTEDVTLFTEDNSDKVYAFMRQILGNDPFTVE